MDNYENYCYKAVRSGKHVELYIFYDMVFKRRTEKSKELTELINSWDITTNEKDIQSKENGDDGMFEVINDQELIKEANMKKNDISLKRSQRRLKRLINANVGQYEQVDKFLTLTFPHLRDRDKACRAFKTFAQNLRRHYGEEIQYIAVMEIQDGSRLEDPSKATNDIHFHVLLFNCPYIPQEIIQNKLWKHGIVDIRKIENYNDIAGYLADYLSKDKVLAVRGKRSYFPSRGLKKPVEEVSMDEKMIFDILKNQNNEIQYVNEFIVDRVGRVGYIKLIEGNEQSGKEITVIN